MRIFLCHASEQRSTVEKIKYALAMEGHDAFFANHAIAAGDDFHHSLREAIARCHLFIFFISPDSVAAANYTLTELAELSARWRNPRGRLLPVVLAPIGQDAAPAYLSQASAFVPTGDVVASVTAEVARIARRRRDALLKAVAIATGALLAFVAAAGGIWWLTSADNPTKALDTEQARKDSVAALRAAAIARGYSEVQIGQTWVLDGKQPSVDFELDVPRLVSSLKAFARDEGQIDVLVGLWAPKTPGDPPAYQVSTKLCNRRSPSYVKCAAATMVEPIAAGMLEFDEGLRALRSDTSLVGWPLAFSPYLRTVRVEDAPWICRHLPVGRTLTPAGSTLVRQIDFELPGCGSHAFPVFAPPAGAPYVPLSETLTPTNQLRTMLAQPLIDSAVVFDTAAHAKISFTQMPQFPGPVRASLVYVWRAGPSKAPTGVAPDAGAGAGGTTSTATSAAGGAGGVGGARPGASDKSKSGEAAASPKAPDTGKGGAAHNVEVGEIRAGNDANISAGEVTGPGEPDVGVGKVVAGDRATIKIGNKKEQ